MNMSAIRVLNNISLYNSITAISGVTTNTLNVDGNAFITGNLNVTGSATFHNTQYTTTSSISVTNNGTGPALVVNQTGEQAIAAFYDDNSIAFYIDGKTGTGGYVGIGTKTPSHELTIVGNVSATGWLYGIGIANNNYNWYFQPNGAIYFPYLGSNNRTGSGNNLVFDKGDGYQKIISTSKGTETRPTVERLVIAGGDSYDDGNGTFSGEGGDIYLWAGRGDDGGDIKVDAGNGINSGGTVKIRGGQTTNNTGGFVHVEAGNSSNGNGGEIQINAGNSSNATGGYINITAGCGSIAGGNITLQTCEGGTHQLVLASTGELTTPNNLVVHGSISATGDIIGTNTISKVVSTFGNGTDTLYEVLHNLGTEDVVVSIIDTTTKEVVYPSVVNYSLSSIKVEFAIAPTLNAYKAVIIG